MTTELLTNPSLAEVNAVLARIAKRVNNGFRARTATLKITPEIWAIPTKRRMTGGDVPGNAYRTKGGSAVSTTVMGAIWAVGRNDDRIVVVSGSRENAWVGSKREYPFNMRVVDWEQCSPYLLLCHVMNQEIAGRTYDLFPDRCDGSLSPMVSPVAAGILAKLITHGSPVITVDGDQDIVPWLLARESLYAAKDHPANAPGPNDRLPRSRK